MDLFKLLGTIAINNAEARKALDEVSNDGQKAESKLSKAFGAMGKGAAVAGKAIATGLAAGATAMAGLTVKALNAAGDLEQNMGGAQQVFKELGGTIGEMSTTIITGYDEATGKAITATSDLETVSKEAFKNMGLSQSDYLATANKMGALFQGAGFETQEALDLSSQAMQRAADVASIMGIDTEAAMEAVAGAAKGNFTMMDNLGVAMNDTAIAAYAQSKGINKATSEMSQQEKIGLAMEMFLEKTSYAAGNYAKENETLAGSLGTAKAAFTNFLSGSGDVTALVSSLSNVANVVVNSITEIAPRLTQGISDLVQQVVPLIPPLLNTLLPVLVEGAVTLVNGLVAALPGIIQAITAVLPALIEGVLQLITSLVQALPQIIQPILDALPQIIQSIIDMLPVLIPALIQGAVQLIVMLCESLPQIIMPIIDNLPMIITTIVTALIENLPALIMGLVQLVLGIVAALPQIFQTLFVELPAALWKGIFDGLGKAFSGLGEWFGKTFSGAKDWAVKAWSDAKEKFNSVKEKCAEGFSNLKDKVGTKFNEAKTKAVEKWNDAKTKFNGVKDKVVSAFSDLKDKVSPLFSEAKENATQTWSTVKGAFEKIKNGDIVGAFSDLGSLLKGKFSTALDAAKKGFDKIKQIGKDLISGLWNGINDKFSWLTGKIKSFAKNVTDKLKGFFGIKSPSRVMRDEVGKQLAEGVAVGITANSDKAESAAEKMGKNVLDAAQKRLDGYKTYNELTLADEVAFWDKVRLQVAEGTDARLQADQKYLDAKKALNEKIIDAEETLQSKMDGIAQKVIDRQTEIVDSFGLFDGFDAKESQFDPAHGLMLGLHADITVMEKWQETINSLRYKLGDSALFKELEAIGVDELENLMIVDRMTEDELAKYVELYDTRAALAETMAKDELKHVIRDEERAALDEYATACEEAGVRIATSIDAAQFSAVESFNALTAAIVGGVEEVGEALEALDGATPSSVDIENRLSFGGVEWFASAMNSPKILKEPTIFGYNSATGKYMGGGEAGSEVISGTNTLMNMIQAAVTEQNGKMVAYLKKIIEMLAAYFPQLIEAFDVDLYLNGRLLATELAPDINDALGVISSRKDRGR